MSESFDEITGRRRYFERLDQAVDSLLDPNTGRIRAETVEAIPCPLCEQDGAFPVLFVKQGFDFVRCPNCGLVFVNPQLRPEYIHSLYADEATFYSAWAQVLLNPSNQNWQIPYFEEALDVLTRYVASGNLLDIGCSIGLFLQIAGRSGFRGIGLELEKEAFEYALTQGLDVRRQTLEEGAFAPESFDAVTMFGVLEHLKDPKSVLRHVWSYLKPGGAVMAIVPNMYSLAGMTLHGHARMFNGRNHLTYFSWKTLPAIFERSGFIVQHLDTCLTALDSILNYWQFNDPQGILTLDYLPPRLRRRLETPTGRQEIEALIHEFDLGLRLRVVATKPGSSSE